ncbi:LON peptidase substrate-binding domain-containing protein, partial [Cryobacterium sp. 10I1]
EHRFGIGTVARITQIEAPEGFVGVVAHGERRIEVLEWLDDDPYPQASVRELPELEWDDELFPLRERAERVVRRALALASEFTEQPWAPDVELSGDPAVAAWQLAAIAPVGPLDQIELLRSESMEALLTRLVEVTEAVADSFGA